VFSPAGAMTPPGSPAAEADPVLRGRRLGEALRRQERAAWEALLAAAPERPAATPAEGIALVTADALDWLARVPEHSLHGIVTDPPYGLIEYEEKDHAKLRRGRGGVWRIPPAFDGVERSPLPRFTVLTDDDKRRLEGFFRRFAALARRALVPGGHLMIASTPLLSTTTFAGFEIEGFEKRGEIIRLVQTLRGGDRPKGAEREFAQVTVMPRACWEPWGLFRNPISERTVAANLRRWGTGGLRRVSDDEPFRDVIESAPTRGVEREIAPHPSLKPQRFMRQLVRAALPLGIGVIHDPFTGGGSTLAAAARLGYRAVGTEIDPQYAALAAAAIPRLRDLMPEE
jgi:site-specific DNA-methyltransferase (adenine-specific)